MPRPWHPVPPGGQSRVLGVPRIGHNSCRHAGDGCRRPEGRQDAGVVLAQHDARPRESATENDARPRETATEDNEGRRENPAPFGS